MRRLLHHRFKIYTYILSPLKQRTSDLRRHESSKNPFDVETKTQKETEASFQMCVVCSISCLKHSSICKSIFSSILPSSISLSSSHIACSIMPTSVFNFLFQCNPRDQRHSSCVFSLLCESSLCLRTDNIHFVHSMLYVYCIFHINHHMWIRIEHRDLQFTLRETFHFFHIAFNMSSQHVYN